MAFVDGVVIAVPDANRTAFKKEALALADLFLECGALEVVDSWGVDVPQGKLTSLPMAVKCEPGESVTFGWVLWPNKRARDSGWKKAMADPRMVQPPSKIYDTKRMIFGGFEVIQSKRKGA